MLDAPARLTALGTSGGRYVVTASFLANARRRGASAPNIRRIAPDATRRDVYVDEAAKLEQRGDVAVDNAASAQGKRFELNEVTDPCECWHIADVIERELLRVDQ